MSRIGIAGLQLEAVNGNNLDSMEAETDADGAYLISDVPVGLHTIRAEADGYESQELIEILNISSANNLWVMLSRGREKLRVCMDKTWFRGPD